MWIHIPGNYPYNCWHLTEEERFDLEKGENLLLVLDIDKYSKLCEKLPPDDLKSFVKSFFHCVEECFDRVRWEFFVNKYLGDGVLATYPSGAFLNVISCCNFAMNRFREDTKGIASKYELTPSLCIILDRVSCIKGGVGTSVYYDYSFWGKRVNRLFKLTKHKKVKEGFIYLTKELVDSLPPEQSDELAETYTIIPKTISYEKEKIHLFVVGVEPFE